MRPIDRALSNCIVNLCVNTIMRPIDKALYNCIVNLCVNIIMRPIDKALYNYCKLMHISLQYSYTKLYLLVSLWY
jgi:hypothetical protein